MSSVWHVGDPVVVAVGSVELAGAISGFPSNRRVEYAIRPVIVKIGPAEYVTVDLSRVRVP